MVLLLHRRVYSEKLIVSDQRCIEPFPDRIFRGEKAVSNRALVIDRFLASASYVIISVDV